MDIKKPKTLFAKTSKKRTQSKKSWKVLIVDDESDVHIVTQTVLSSFSFQDKSIKFFNAYSAKEALEIMKNEDGIALVLLDVVMEEDDSGLKVAKAIREDLHNSLVRIILRTGQPGSAPEESVIINYDINDYKEKTDLTSKKLFTTMITALRGYHDLESLQKGKEGLKLVLESSYELCKLHSLEKFTQGTLIQMLAIMNFNSDSMYLQSDGFTVKNADENFTVLAATGKCDSVGRELEPEIVEMLKESIKQEKSIFKDNAFVGYSELNEKTKHLIYIKIGREMTSQDREMIDIFLKNISIAFEHISIREEALKKLANEIKKG